MGHRPWKSSSAVVSGSLAGGGEDFRIGSLFLRTRLLINGMIVVGTGKGAFIIVVVTGTELLSSDNPPVALPLPPLAMPIAKAQWLSVSKQKSRPTY